MIKDYVSSSCRRFYWNHDRFRRLCNHWRLLLFVIGIQAATILFYRDEIRNSQDRVDSYRSSYWEASGRAQGLDQQLKSAINEQKALRQELSRCREQQR